jgi:flagellar hook assembly protein FlgD
VAGLGTSRPNPFERSTTIPIHLGEVDRVELRIYDADGRHVRTLADGPLGPGTHRVAWDGRDDAGVSIAAGVYYIRLATGSGVTTRKVVRLP